MKVKVVSGLFGVSVGISSHVLKIVDENFLNSSMVSPALLSAEMTKQDCGGTFAMVKRFKILLFEHQPLYGFSLTKGLAFEKSGFEFFYNGKLSFNSQFSSVDKTKLLSHFPTEKEPQFRKKPSSFLI